MAAAHLGANVLQDLVDDLTGADAAARADGASVATGSGAIGMGIVGRADAVRLVAILSGIAAAATILLAPARSVETLAWGIAAGSVVLAGSAPLAARFPAIGEVCALVGGLLAATAGARSQGGDADAGLLAGSVPALFAMLVALNRQFLRYRGDRATGVRSTVGLLGVERALVVSAAAGVAPFVALTALVATGRVPAAGLAGLAAAVPLAAAWVAARADHLLVQRHLAVLGSTLGSALASGVVLAIVLGYRAAAG